MYSSNPQYEDKQPVLDHCGLFAIVSPKDTAVFSEAISSFQTLQTRGYDGAGFWSIDTKGKEHLYKQSGMIRKIFSKNIIKKYERLKAKTFLFQNRYGTSGDLKVDNVQPFRMVHKLSGEIFTVIHNGQFIKKHDDDFNEHSDTWEFTSKLANSKQEVWPERITSVLKRMKGAYSVIIATEKSGVFAVRDSLGIRPLSYGTYSKKAPYKWVIASETVAIEQMGANNIKEVMPGSIVGFSPEKVIFHKKKTRFKKRAHCIFENVYIMDERTKTHRKSEDRNSIQSHPTINLARFRSGQILAEEAPVNKKEIDFVCGIPGTGITGGQGYANFLLLPYVQAISDKALPTEEQRTFMQSNKDEILSKVYDHFSIVFSMFKDKKVVLVDDSLVRGNVTKGLIKILREQANVKKVHIRILCPQIDKPCYLGINTRESKELLSYQCENDLNKIKTYIGADSLNFISSKGLLKAITNNEKSDEFCLGCMVGHKPPFPRVLQ